MARPSGAGQRFGTGVVDANRVTDIVSDALIQHRITQLRSALEARVGSGPFSGRRSFGRHVGTELYGRESLEWPEDESR